MDQLYHIRDIFAVVSDRHKLLAIVNKTYIDNHNGSKYISLELSKTQEDYVKYTLGRQILVFAILWMGTRDIVIALLLTCVFIVFADYLLNDNCS